jgi:hypothetical protein
MKTFESEFAELADWIRQKTKEDSEARKKNPPVGKDGKLVYERRQVVKEYNRKLIELKKKYGIETTTAKEQIPQGNFAYVSGK